MKTLNEMTRTLAEELVRLVSESPRVRRQFEKMVQPVPEKPPLLSDLKLDRQVRTLEVRYESDSSLELRLPGKSARVVSCRELGFRDDRSKSWKFLIEALGDSQGGFDFGTAYVYPDGRGSNRLKNRAYDSRWKLCDEACKRLVRFFEREYGWTFPRGYKLYEKSPTASEGQRRFKFQVKKPRVEESGAAGFDELTEKTRQRFSALTEAELILEIQKLNDDFLISSSEENPEKLLLAYETGKAQFGWSEDTMRTLLEA